MVILSRPVLPLCLFKLIWLLFCCSLGEVEFCSANPILKYTQEDLSQRGVFGTLFCTNFRVTFISDETPQEETVRIQQTLLFWHNRMRISTTVFYYSYEFDSYENVKKKLRKKAWRFTLKPNPQWSIVETHTNDIIQICQHFTEAWK